ncbi:MAG TPA: hypothetical protein VNJ03_00355 [Vicinamibacterales bacterium]|nr:hypothetical protein [Vicinamibacterales bacterium]
MRRTLTSLLISLVYGVGPAHPAARDIEKIPCVRVSAECPSRPEPPVTSYRAIRRMSATNDRYKLTGWLEAWTELEAGKGFTFGVATEGGSGYIRTKVLRKVLEAEGDAVAAKEGDRAGLTSENYVFGEPERIEDGLLRISLRPRRADKLLIDGAMFVTESDRDLVRIEGRLSKAPSFWTRRVEIVRTYGRIDGHRVALETTSTASVLVAGESSFTMRYEYERINGVAVGAPAPVPAPGPAPRLPIGW